MAWIVRESIAMEDNPKMNWDGQTLSWIHQAATEVRASLAHLNAKPGDALFMKSYLGWKDQPPVGLPYPAPPGRMRAVIEEIYGPLPDALRLGIVNAKIKDAVERFEPGVHQFFPVDLVMPDGTINQDYWCMRICHRVDAIALEHCNELYEWRPKPAQYPDWILYRGNEDNRFRLAIYKDRVAGMAMWHDWRMSRHFLSEELGQFCIDNGVRGYRLKPEDDLMRSNHVMEV